MKHLILIALLLLCISSLAATEEEPCFKAYQDGEAVDVICNGRTVSFRNCTLNLPNDATVLFYLGPKEEINENSETIAEGEEITFPGVNTYTVTLILNRAGEPEYLEREFEVKAEPEPNYTARLCTGNEMVVTITDQQYDYFIVDFKDGSQVIKAFQGETKRHNYSGNGPFEVAVTGYYNAAVCSSPEFSMKIDAQQPYTPPAISKLEVTEQHTATGSVFFNFDNLLGGYSYTLSKKQAGENNFTPVTIIAPNQTTFPLNNINTAVPATYRLDVTDGCGNTLESSNTLSSIVLHVTPENGFNLVQWQSAESLQLTEIYRNGSLLPLNNPSSPYRDTDVTCGSNYVYEVRGKTANNSATSISYAQQVTTSSTIRPPTGTLLATYNLDNQVEVNFTAPDGEMVQEVNFYRSLDNTPPSLLTTVFNTTEIIDELSEPMRVCYSATFKNECALSEMSQPVCPMLLTGQQSPDGAFLLNWSAYVGFPEGIAGYTVELLDENNQLVDSYSATGTTYTHTNSNSDMQVLRYRIKAVSNTGAITYSNLVQAEQVVQLHIPSGFTPNGDGLNDLFEVKGKFIKDFVIKIYNGMGQVVFSSNDRQESWDGTYKGSPLPAGAYAYEVSVTSESGKLKKRTGTVTLLR